MGSSTTSLYRRPTASLALPLDHWPANTACSLASSCSEQVHLAIGAPGEMLVLFATHDDTTPSEVTWWASDDAGDVRKATGTASAYTQLLWLEPYLVTPPLGQPTATMTELLDRQNTASWAFDSALPPPIAAMDREPHEHRPGPEPEQALRTRVLAQVPLAPRSALA